jgi:tetratricopeptide (TPR) repeat protein
MVHNSVSSEKTWSYPRHTLGDDAAAARRAAEALVRPLRLESMRYPFDPAEAWMDDLADALPDTLLPVIASGPREAFEFEQLLVGDDEELVIDYIIEAGDLARAGDRVSARRLLRRIIERDPRCIDAHGHLGWLYFDYSAKRALPHYLVAVAIGERSIPDGFGGLLPWSLIDNRPFLRALHGLALCRWRLGDFAYAHAICESLLWLTPNDNQGVRDIIDPIARRLPWLPQDAWG